jgi:hypothetical protein
MFSGFAKEKQKTDEFGEPKTDLLIEPKTEQSGILLAIPYLTGRKIL